MYLRTCLGAFCTRPRPLRESSCEGTRFARHKLIGLKCCFLVLLLFPCSSYAARKNDSTTSSKVISLPRWLGLYFRDWPCLCTLYTLCSQYASRFLLCTVLLTRLWVVSAFWSQLALYLSLSQLLLSSFPHKPLHFASLICFSDIGVHSSKRSIGFSSYVRRTSSRLLLFWFAPRWPCSSGRARGVGSSSQRRSSDAVIELIWELFFLPADLMNILLSA